MKGSAKTHVCAVTCPAPWLKSAITFLWGTPTLPVFLKLKISGPCFPIFFLVWTSGLTPATQHFRRSQEKSGPEIIVNYFAQERHSWTKTLCSRQCTLTEQEDEPCPKEHGPMGLIQGSRERWDTELDGPMGLIQGSRKKPRYQARWAHWLDLEQQFLCPFILLQESLRALWTPLRISVGEGKGNQPSLLSSTWVSAESTKGAV